MRRVSTLVTAIGLGLASPGAAQMSAPDRDRLEASVARAEWPMAIYVAASGDGSFGAANGLADADAGRRLTADTPLRIASNTKTFTAATLLRLWEQDRLDLDAPIAPLLTPSIEALLRADGYDTSRITVRQLMSHSAGLYDHGGDPRFTDAIFSDPNHRWTREALVRLSMHYADPQSAPGTEFRYSDTGYILLGDIIERETGQSLAAAVRAQLKFDQLGLGATWWEVMESPPPGAEPRARQWLGEREATGVHASMDLYGGGGLLMSARDLALFTEALFEGRVFDRAGTLREMLRAGLHRGGEDYRLGIFIKSVGERQFYWHSGFWGTIVYFVPDSGLAVAGVTTNQAGFRDLLSVVEASIGASPGSAEAP